jgi:hypothetical protein
MMIVKIFSLPYHQYHHSVDETDLQSWLRNQNPYLFFQMQSHLSMIQQEYRLIVTVFQVATSDMMHHMPLGYYGGGYPSGFGGGWGYSQYIPSFPQSPYMQSPQHVQSPHVQSPHVQSPHVQSPSNQSFQQGKSFKRRQSEIEFDAAYQGLSDQEKAFFQALKDWRSQTATAQGFAVYQVATNLGLFDIVKKQPKTLDELKQLNGWGHARLKSFGQLILQVSQSFLQSQNLKSHHQGSSK